MIPAQGMIAVFNETDADGRVAVRQRPVVAWDDHHSHRAMVVNSGGYLEVANELPGFEAIYPAPVPPVVIRGGGWLGELTVDGQSWSMPVVAWRIAADGTGEPLFVDSDGHVTGDLGIEEIRLWHPDASADGWTAPRTEDGGGP
jgi:hypothetical protein